MRCTPHEKRRAGRDRACRLLLCSMVLATMIGGCSANSDPDDEAERSQEPSSAPTRPASDIAGVMDDSLREAAGAFEEVMPILEDGMAEVMSSPWSKRLLALMEFVDMRTVVGSEAGNAGFILRLDGNRWAAAYRDGDRVEHASGTGAPPRSILDAIRSPAYGDASAPIRAEVARANEPCDVAAEVARCRGRSVEGVEILGDRFYFWFSGNRELIVQLVDDKDGKPAFRAFLETR